MVSIKDFIKNRITELVASKNVSEKKISELLGYNRSFISNIMSGNSMPSIEALDAICRYFGITMADFFQGTLKFETSAEYLYQAMDAIVQPEDVDDLLKIVATLNNQNIKNLIASYKKFSEHKGK